MEEAESKRLLYVACTRAADLLILSGKMGYRNSWLTEILDAWSISSEGPIEEVLSHRKFTIKVHRPMNLQQFRKIELANRQEPTKEFGDIPDQASPFRRELERVPISVTQLAKDVARDGFIPGDFQPAIWDSEISRTDRVSGRLVGRIVHKVLALWEPLSYDDRSYIDLLETLVIKEGVSPDKVSETVRRSGEILNSLRAHPVYDCINQAVKRYHEYSFTLEIDRGVVHGVIDMLYQDEDGNWHLVDWKTDWTSKNRVEVVAGDYLVQMACYTLAAERILGVKPEMRMWFLQPDIRCHKYSEAELSVVAESCGFITPESTSV
jgi:ATP-dependent helicase/nuclease subunit A